MKPLRSRNVGSRLDTEYADRIDPMSMHATYVSCSGSSLIASTSLEVTRAFGQRILACEY